jgi:hypothetical protein
MNELTQSKTLTNNISTKDNQVRIAVLPTTIFSNFNPRQFERSLTNDLKDITDPNELKQRLSVVYYNAVQPYSLDNIYTESFKTTLDKGNFSNITGFLSQLKINLKQSEELLGAKSVIEKYNQGNLTQRDRFLKKICNDIKNLEGLPKDEVLDGLSKIQKSLNKGSIRNLVGNTIKDLKDDYVTSSQMASLRLNNLVNDISKNSDFTKANAQVLYVNR